MPTKVFFCAALPTARRKLRVYESRTCGVLGCGFCDASIPLDVVDKTRAVSRDSRPSEYEGQWPASCDSCKTPFTAAAKYQVFSEWQYRRSDNGEIVYLRTLPVGAVYDAVWDSRKGPDGRALVCQTPGGSWSIDNRASNCTMPGDDEHRCWVRHGRPEDGTLHVDKNGHTCAAGAGSIVAGSYHGFLHNGFLTDGC
jgi:hypothetical protein